MGTLTIVFWRDIPSQVIVKSDQATARRQLAQRFQDGIDQAAMVSGAHDSDAYTDSWRRTNAGPCGDDAEAEATDAVARLEADYPLERLLDLVRAGGSLDE